MRPSLEQEVVEWRMHVVASKMYDIAKLKADKISAIRFIEPDWLIEVYEAEDDKDKTN